MATYSVRAVLEAVGADKFAQAFQNATKHADKLQQVSGKMKGVGKRMTTAVTLPIVGMATAIATTGAKFDDQMSTVQAVTGATGKEMDKLREQAKKMGRETRFSASEAAEGQEMLARAGFETTEIMDALPSVLSLAAAGAVDLGDAADITSNILSGFGMEATETARVADILAKASSDSNTDIEGLGESMKYVAPIASDLGVSIEDTTAAIGLLGDAGIQGGQAGRQLRSGLQSLAAPTEKASKLMDELGIEVFDAEGNMKSMPEVVKELEDGLEGMSSQQQAAALETLFGADAMSAWSILVGEGSDELGAFSKELQNSEGTADDMAATMEDNLAGSFRELMSALEGLSIEFYELGEGPLRTLVDKITDAVRWFTGLSDETKQWIMIAAGIAAAIGPIIWVLGSILGAIGPIITAFKILGGVIAAITSPIGLVVAAIIAAAVLIYIYWEPIKEFFINLWEYIKDVAIAVWDWVVEAWEAAVQFFIDLWNGIKEFFSGLWESITETVSNAWDRIVESFVNAKDRVMDIITSVYDWLNDKTGGAFGTMLSTVRDNLQKMWDFIKTIWDFIKNTFKNQLKFIKSLLTGDFEGMRDAVKGQMDNIKGFIDAAWNFIKNIFSNVLNNIKSVVTNAFNAVRNTISNIINNIRSRISNVFGSLRGIVSNAFNAVRNAVSNGMRGAYNAVTNILGNFKDAGRRIVTSIADGIRGAIGQVKDAIGNVTSAIRNFLPFSPAKDGPLRDLNKLNFGGTIAESIKRGANKVLGVTDTLASQIAQSMHVGTIDTQHTTMQTSTGGVYEFNVTVPLDGRTIARQTVRFTAEELETMKRQNKRR